MATKLDNEFVEAATSQALGTVGALKAMISEVRRLEAYSEALEKRLTHEQIAEASAEASKNW